MPSSEWSVTIRDRCHVTHATQPGNPRGSTFLIDANYSGNSLNQTCNLTKIETSSILRNLLNNHFDGRDLSNAVTTEGKPCSIEVITKEIWELLSQAQEYDPALVSLSVTISESDLLSVKYLNRLPNNQQIENTNGKNHEKWFLSIRNQIRSAHSFTGEQFGPCQNLHGITWIVTVEFSGLNPMFEDHVKASCMVEEACQLYDLKNLDIHKDFYQCNTTCEVIARQVWLVLAHQLLANKGRGAKGIPWYGVESMRIIVHESDEAFVEYEQSLSALYDEINAIAAKDKALKLLETATAQTSASAAAAAASASEHHQSAMTDASVNKARNEAIQLAQGAQNASQESNIAHEQAMTAAAQANSSKRGAYFRVAVRGRAMVARSLLEASSPSAGGVEGDQVNQRGPLHGNTIVVDAIFTGRELQEDAGYMIDICILMDLVNETVNKIHNENLDDSDIAWRLCGPFGEKQQDDLSIAPSSELLACWVWRSLVGILPPLERSQTCGLKVVVKDGGWGEYSFEAPLWPEVGNNFTIQQDAHYLEASSNFYNEFVTSTSQYHKQVNSTSDGDDGIKQTNRIPVLVIDFDGCLFHHPELHSGADKGGLIARKVHAHCLANYGLSPSACDDLYQKYGDTCMGLLLTGQFKQICSSSNDGGKDIRACIDAYYRDVYGGIDFDYYLSNHYLSSTASQYDQITDILATTTTTTTTTTTNTINDMNAQHTTTPSGIQHDQGISQLSKLLASIPCPKLICSNSPEDTYIQPFLNKMNMAHIGWSDIITPMTFLHPKTNSLFQKKELERSGKEDDEESKSKGELITKSNPKFYEAILKRYPSSHYQVILFDDSLINLRIAEACGMHAYLVKPGQRSLYDAILEALQCLPASSPPLSSPSLNDESSSKISDSGGDAYLTAKQVADDQALNQEVQEQLVKRLATLSSSSSSERVLCVLDTGAGTLSMLSRVVDMAAAAGFDKVEYCAVEMQSSLLSAATSRLVSSQDFQQETQEQPLSTTKAPIVNLGHFVGHLQSNNKSVEVRLTPLVADLSKSNETELLSQMSSQHTLHFDLVVACSFADLMAPWKFAKMMSILAPGSLLYLPITFAGGTRYDSDHYEECKGLGRRQGSSLEAGRIPDETVIEQIYHQHLTCVEGQYIDLKELLKVLQEKGFKLQAEGESNWKLTCHDKLMQGGSYNMWHAMLGFVCRANSASLFQYGWSPAQWLSSKQASTASSLTVFNKDLLLEIPACHVYMKPDYEALVMIAPREVQVETRNRNSSKEGAEASEEGVGGGGGGVSNSSQIIPPGQVEVETIVTMISNGTELKFFRGDFGDSEPLDETIEGMSEKAASYPLEYGYSMIGKVIGCGEGVDGREWLGETVFLFHPHASAAIYDVKGLIRVPPGIDPLDAVFLPAVETALSIVHDAHPRAGERVAVIGQGLIGLLVTRILSDMNMEVITIEVRPGRRQLSKLCGATVSLPPEAFLKTSHSNVDVAIEVSGNTRALQLAIDCCRQGGKCIIASWYSETAKLNLGTLFHRSHIQMIASQVSHLPAAVSLTWSKERRFEATWKLIGSIKPGSELFVSSRLQVPLSQSQFAYESLERGDTAVAIINYDKNMEKVDTLKTSEGVEALSRL